MGIRDRLAAALRGEVVTHPVYVVYDAFLPNPTVDWDLLFAKGLGRINHASVTETRHPNCEIVERTSLEGGLERRDVTIRTAGGELHEYYLGASDKGVLPWRMEHFIKKPSDYRLMAEAFAGSTYTARASRRLTATWASASRSTRPPWWSTAPRPTWPTASRCG